MQIVVSETEVKEKQQENKDNNNENNINNNGFKLGYTINRKCLIMDRRTLNIPSMRHANPLENLIKRQRILDEKGEVMRSGSQNYEINNLEGHVQDSDRIVVIMEIVVLCLNKNMIRKFISAKWKLCL